MIYVNRFDSLRLILACGVCLYHLVVLSALDPNGDWETALGVWAELSIQGFFIVSGALVYGSWQRSDSLRDYAGKRVRRLYPAYAIIILVPALVSLGLSRDWHAVAHYLGANLLFMNFLQPDLPGLFAENRFVAVNGALWTLKIEVMFYIVLPSLAWLITRLGRAWPLVLATLIGCSLVWGDFVDALDLPYGAQLTRQLPGQLMYFAVGMALWRWRDLARRYPIPLFLCGALLLVISVGWDVHILLRALSLVLCLAGLAYMPGPALPLSRWGDISYGIYIIHFPVIQACVALGLFDTLSGLMAGLICCVVIVFVSYLLWWTIEKPFLRRDSHYRQM